MIERFSASQTFSGSGAFGGWQGCYRPLRHGTQLFLPVLQHRILVRAEGRVQGADASQILSFILKQVPVPTRQ